MHLNNSESFYLLCLANLLYDNSNSFSIKFMLLLILQNNIIKNKDASMLPFPMIASGTFVGFLWLIYGLLIDNIFIKVITIQIY